MQGAAFSLLSSNVLPIISRPEIRALVVRLFQTLSVLIKMGLKVTTAFDSVITKNVHFNISNIEME